MDSMPPATTMELLPVCIACAASATDFNPEPQTLLIVMAPVAGESPPKIAACRAGFCPSPAETTLPMMHSSTCVGIEAGALDRFAHDDGAELRRGEIGEAALKFSDWGAAAGDDDNIVKRGHESSSREDFAILIIDAARRRMRRGGVRASIRRRRIANSAIPVMNDFEQARVMKCCAAEKSRRACDALQKIFLTFRYRKLCRRDFGVSNLRSLIVIFFLTSFFINSIHQLVAVEDHCDIFHEEWKGE